MSHRTIVFGAIKSVKANPVTISEDCCHPIFITEDCCHPIF